MTESEKNQTQCFGRKKNATAVAYVTDGKGFIRVNGKAVELVDSDETLTVSDVSDSSGVLLSSEALSLVLF
jgi:ribosomal protein S9